MMTNIILLISCMTLSMVYSLDYYAVDRQRCTQDSECTGNNPDADHVCLGSYCFKRCTSDNNCQSDPEYVCITYPRIGSNGQDESICKPADCQECIDRPYPPYPTNMPEATTAKDKKFDYESYSMTHQTCTTKSDCKGKSPNAVHDCLGGYCFKECKNNNQCRDDPDFVCINYPSLKKGLCKPEGCQECIDRPYPTRVDAVFAADMESDGGLWSLTSELQDQPLMKIGTLIVVGVFIILAVYYKWKNGLKGKEDKMSINESPASAVGISSV